MTINEAIQTIETCSSAEQLKIQLSRVIEDYGFCSFNFVDIGNPHQDVPYYIGTTDPEWQSDYIQNDFILDDPILARARRINVPFAWSDVDVPKTVNGRRTRSRIVMEAAQDHGFRDGLVFPLHFRDTIGRLCSCLVVLFWNDALDDFQRRLRSSRNDISLILLYWMQKLVEFIAEQDGKNLSMGELKQFDDHQSNLTARERQVLSWAARGKTTSEIADIMSISFETAKTHTKSALNKLGASNRTHAVVRAIYLNLIDV